MMKLDRPGLRTPVLQPANVFAAYWQRWLGIVWETLTDAIDRIVVLEASSYSETGPPTDTTAWLVEHSLDTEDVLAAVREVATGEFTGQTIKVVDSNHILVTSSPDMATNAFRVTVKR